MNNNEVLDRLQKLINYMPTQKEISEKTGINQNTLSAKSSRNSQWKDDDIQKLNNAYGIDIYKEISQNITEYEEPTINGDYYPDVFGSCGNGTFILSDNKEKIKIPERCFIKPISKVKKYSVINAVGDSMYPTINDKDCLIIQHCESEPVQDRSIYVFCYDNQIFVKRLYHNIDEIMIKSDNPEFKTKFIQKEDMNNLILIGQVVGLMRDLR